MTEAGLANGKKYGDETSPKQRNIALLALQHGKEAMILAEHRVLKHNRRTNNGDIQLIRKQTKRISIIQKTSGAGQVRSAPEVTPMRPW